MDSFKKLTSAEDASVNFVAEAKHPKSGLIEARFVQRSQDYFIVYLSSQTGCDKACRMCHLTATGQNDSYNLDVSQFVDQANVVLDHYDQAGIDAPLVHYNFMSRGEPLDNPLMVEHSHLILRPLAELAKARGLEYKFLISTILPNTLGYVTSLPSIFSDPELYPEIYYSLYSVNPSFRKRWLARAHRAELGLDMLAEWQRFSGKVPKIHFAFIEGENDSEEDVRALCEAITSRDLRVNFNIVRYNPHSEKYGKESDEATINRNVDIMRELLKPDQFKIVPKVGFDIKASCGMFVEDY